MAEITLIPESIEIIRLSDEEYFSDKYKDYISNSKLGLLNPAEGGSFEKFKKGFDNGYSSSYELGSAVHCNILQADEFFISDLRKPSGKLGVFAETVFKFRKQGLTLQEALKNASMEVDYYSKSFTLTRQRTAIRKSLPFYLNKLSILEEVEGKTPIYLSDAMYDKYVGCCSSLLSNKDVIKKLQPETFITPVDSYNEYAIFCTVEVMLDTGEFIPIKIKGKMDNFTVDQDLGVLTLNDLKTTGKPINYFTGNFIKKPNENGDLVKEWIPGSFEKYHYYRQIALYLWLLQAAFAEESYKLEANILVVESFPDYKSKVIKINNAHIKAGLKELKNLLVYYAEWKKLEE